MKNKTISNVVFSASYQILILFVPLATTPYITRIFSPNQIGVYAASLAIVGFFVVAAAFGLPLFGSREIAKATREERTDIFYEFFSMQVITSVCSYLIFLAMITVMKLSNYYYVQSLLILVNILDVSWFFIGIEEIKRTLYRNFLSKMFTMIGIFVFVKSKNDLSLYMILNIMGMLLGNLLMVFQLRRFIPLRFRFIFPRARTFRRSFGILVSQLVSSAKNSFDRIILLGLTGSNSFVGIYDQGRKIINIIIAVSNSATIALLPKMTSTMQDKSKGNELQLILKKIIPIIFIASVFLGSSVFLNAKAFVDVFFGNGYANVTEVLRIFSLALLVLPINYFLLNGILLPKSHDKQYQEIFIISALVLFIGNIILDKSFGYIGAAFSFVISEYITFICINIFLKNDQSFSRYLVPFILSTIDYGFCITTGTLIVQHVSFPKNGIILFLLNATITTVYFAFVQIIVLMIYKYFKNRMRR